MIFETSAENLQTWWRRFPISTNQLGVCFFSLPTKTPYSFFKVEPPNSELRTNVLNMLSNCSFLGPKTPEAWWSNGGFRWLFLEIYLRMQIYIFCIYQVIQFVTKLDPRSLEVTFTTTTLDRSGHVFIHRAPKKGKNRRIARFFFKFLFCISIGRNSSSKSIQRGFCAQQPPPKTQPLHEIGFICWNGSDPMALYNKYRCKMPKKPFMLMWRCLLSRFCWVHKFCFTKFWVLEIGGVGWLGNWHGYWHCKLELSKVV